MSTLQAAAATPFWRHHTLVTVLFALVVLTTLGTAVCARRRNRAAEDFYTGGRGLSPSQNGLALFGDHVSAASFLGVAGLIALHGYDGVLYSIGFLAAWLVVLMLVAELVRNCGRYTVADVLAVRMRQRSVQAAAGTAGIVISLLYLVAQLVGTGSLVALLLGTEGGRAEDWTIVGIGALMAVHVMVGGMRPPPGSRSSRRRC